MSPFSRSNNSSAAAEMVAQCCVCDILLLHVLVNTSYLAPFPSYCGLAALIKLLRSSGVFLFNALFLSDL